MKLAWLTDPHLNFASIQAAERLMSQVKQWQVDALLVSGDIGESVDLEGWLMLMAGQAGCPVYFVLGNHDYYRSSIAIVRQEMVTLCADVDALTWLSGERAPIALSEHTALVGHDGWGDGRCGDVMNTPVMLSDFVAIDDLRGLSRIQLAQKLAALGDECAEHLRHVVELALNAYSHVVVLMHVPPFEVTAWHEGYGSNAQWSPFFVCQAAGDVLMSLARHYSDRRITVLCGHTHSAGMVFMAPNLQVITGEATYRKPALQAPIVVM